MPGQWHCSREPIPTSTDSKLREMFPWVQYRLVSGSGPPFARNFVVCASITDRLSFVGISSSKEKARQEAAQQALNFLSRQAEGASVDDAREKCVAEQLHQLYEAKWWAELKEKNLSEKLQKNRERLRDAGHRIDRMQKNHQKELAGMKKVREQEDEHQPAKKARVEDLGTQDDELQQEEAVREPKDEQRPAEKVFTQDDVLQAVKAQVTSLQSPTDRPAAGTGSNSPRDRSVCMKCETYLEMMREKYDEHLCMFKEALENDLNLKNAEALMEQAADAPTYQLQEIDQHLDIECKLLSQTFQSWNQVLHS